MRRFKRVGPNAMKGRGIGTARGRATIMRGTYFLILVLLWHLIFYSIANGMAFLLFYMLGN